jgi:hypothetical protein
MRARCSRISPFVAAVVTAAVFVGVAVGTTVGAVVVGSASAASAADPPFSQYTKTTNGPRGPVTVIGDSLMLGSALETGGYGPSVAQMLVDRGWGPVRMVAGVGLQAGLVVASSNPGANMTKWVRDRRAEGWDSPVYMVNLGANDIGSCNNNQTCAERDILGLVDTIGADREIWWPLITMPAQRDADVWNGALASAASKRPNLHLWDWPAAQVANSIPLSTDGVHLPTGAAYVRRSMLMADDFTARLGVSQHVGPAEPAPTPLGEPSVYVPLIQHRLYDSRLLAARPQSVQLDLSAEVPPGTTAVSINLTAASAAGGPQGFLTAYPCGAAPPLTSSVNFDSGQIRPNQVVVGLGAGNQLCISVSVPADVIVDLQGAFVPSAVTPADGLTLHPSAPLRLVDTRDTGRADPLVVAMPAGAAGAVVNVTAVGAAADGFMVAYPCDSPMPDTSNLNFVTGSAAAGSAYVRIGAAGTICVHANVAVDMVVDLQGTFTPTGGLRFQTANPQRMLDTRLSTGGWRGQVGMGQTIEATVAPAAAQAVTGNLTLVQPGQDGFGTAFACGQAVPATSSVNADRGSIVANAVTAASSSSLCLRTSVGTHVIFDTTGWWIP